MRPVYSRAGLSIGQNSHPHVVDGEVRLSMSLLYKWDNEPEVLQLSQWTQTGGTLDHTVKLKTAYLQPVSLRPLECRTARCSHFLLQIKTWSHKS